MSYRRFLSREKLFEYLNEELRHFLNAAGIYEISQYGWQCEGEPDPEYLGHTLWQQDPPELPKLVALGEEFSNLMRSARHSLGLTFLYGEDSETLIGDSGSCFSFHYTDTVSKLNLATDRIREFLITAFVRQAPWGAKSWPAAGKVLRGDGFYSNFLRPFQQIKDEVEAGSESSTPLRQCLAKLIPLSQKAARYRSENQDPAKHLALFQERLADLATNLAQGYPDDVFAAKLPPLDAQTSPEKLKDWYLLLVNTSSQVFTAEHLLRGLTARNTGTVKRRTSRQQVI